jgi:hypothetical protein
MKARGEAGKRGVGPGRGEAAHIPGVGEDAEGGSLTHAGEGQEGGEPAGKERVRAHDLQGTGADFPSYALDAVRYALQVREGREDIGPSMKAVEEGHAVRGQARLQADQDGKEGKGVRRGLIGG